jgi:hypothetical protein
VINVSDRKDWVMQLLTDERIILESDPRALTLTTHRVRYEYNRTGRGEVISIMLEEIASCAIARRSRPLLLIIAAIIFLLALVLATTSQYRSNVFFVGGLIVSGLLVVAYSLTKQQVLEIASAGASIQQATASMKMESVVDFIDAVEEAKNERYRGVGGTSSGLSAGA